MLPGTKRSLPEKSKIHRTSLPNFRHEIRADDVFTVASVMLVPCWGGVANGGGSDAVHLEHPSRSTVQRADVEKARERHPERRLGFARLDKPHGQSDRSRSHISCTATVRDRECHGD